MILSVSFRHVTVVMILFLIASFALSVPGVAVSGGGDATPSDLGGMPGHPQSDANVSQQNTTGTNATVTFTNQTSNGSAVTIESATLPDSGFVVIHDSEYVENRAPSDSSVIAVSEPLDAGTHRNVTVDISNAPPSNYPGLNRSRLNSSQPLAATIYRDTNDNQRFDYVQSFGENDTAYISEGGPVSDDAGISVPSAEEERRTASVAVTNQSLRNNTLVVERARMPEGGFLVAYNESYQRTGDPLTSAVGVSRYLPPGNHTDVSVRVLPDALNSTQAVTIRPAKDTNDNQQYDYIQSDGFRDVAYETLNRSDTVSQTAQVSVPRSEPTPPQTRTPPSAQTDVSSTASTPTAANGVGDSGGPFGSFGLVEMVGFLILVVGAILVAAAIR